MGINSEDFNIFKKASEISFNSDILDFKSSLPVIDISNSENILLFISNPISFNILVLDISSNIFSFESFRHKKISLKIFIIFSSIFL